MKIVAAFFAGFIVAIGFSSRATDLFAELGQCRFGLERNGTFYQYGARSTTNAENTQNYMTPSCLSIGLADKFKDSPSGWRVAFLAAESIQARDNIATMRDDDSFTIGTCDPTTGQHCVGSMNGSGQTWGISGSLTHELRYAEFRAIGEAGLFFFHHNFRNNPRQLDCTTGHPLCGQHEDYNESSQLWDMPSPFVGLTLRYGDLYATVRRYWATGNRALSLTDHSFTQLSLGYVLGKF